MSILNTDFQVDGFLLLEAYLDSTELRQLRDLVEAKLASPSHEETCKRPHNTLVPLRWNDPALGLIASERRGKFLADALQADDLKWISAYISVKEPHSPPSWWHQDWWCWDHPVTYLRATTQVAVLVYLADTSADNGGLRVLPGSHQKSSPIHALLPEAHSVAAEELKLEHPAFNDLPDQRTLCVRAGDAVVIDYRLLHGTHSNHRDDRRDCVLLSFTPCWKRLPRDIKAHLIAHPAQPTGSEWTTVPIGLRKLLPSFDGEHQDLPLNRNAPSTFEVFG